jgi:hypothetical protein
MLEQRKNQRFDIRLPIEFARTGGKNRVSGETKNISSSGVLFMSPEKVSIGDSIEYLITFPKPPGTKSLVRLRCVGKILRQAAEESFAATLERYEFLREPV